MKRFLFIAIIFALLSSVSSCGKEENTLDQTTWIGHWDGEVYYIDFHSSSTGTLTIGDRFDHWSESEWVHFTYTYTPPNITLSFLDYEMMTGTVNGNNMMLEEIRFIKDTNYL